MVVKARNWEGVEAGRIVRKETVLYTNFKEN